jgi:hypothetical protein
MVQAQGMLSTFALALWSSESVLPVDNEKPRAARGLTHQPVGYLWLRLANLWGVGYTITGSIDRVTGDVEADYSEVVER